MEWNVNSNELYLKRELQDKARLSYMTRVIYRLESESGFLENAKCMAIIGTSQQMGSSLPVASYKYEDGRRYYQNDTFRAYCNYILDYGIHYCDADEVIELTDNPVVQKLSPYPEEECVAVVDGVYVIKVADIATWGNE